MEELFIRIRKEFGEFNKKSRKVNELRLLKQRSKTYNEYIQIFRKTARGDGYLGRLLVEEFKRGINGVIRRRLVEAESPLFIIEE